MGVFFGGKAAPGYYMAKKIIKLIKNVADVVNNDPTTSEYLKVIFIANYNVSKAEIIIPASDISQHISTAGMEASGTSNMKFVLNGGIIIGTLDGANIEIREEIRTKKFEPSTPFKQALGMIHTGLFGQPEQFSDLIASVTNGNDYYLVSYDFDSYIEAQNKIDAAYKQTEYWTKMSICNSIRCAKFSSDRTIRQYANEIWNVTPVRRPGPVPVEARMPDDSNLLRPGRTISLELPSPATRAIRQPVVKKQPAKTVQIGFNL